MSDDWAKNYIEVHRQRQQEQKNRQKRADLAEAGAPGVFHRILDRIRQDLETFHDAGVLRGLKLEEETAEKKFKVTWHSVPSPMMVLDVVLSIKLIRYTLVFSLGRNNRPEQVSGDLRICSDLDGVVKVYRKEGSGGHYFEEESEVSEFLLQLLLTYIDK